MAIIATATSMIAFDTLQYAKKLKEAGCPEKQAEIQAEALAEIVQDKLATKMDLELKLAELKANLIKWILGIVLSVSTAQAAVIIACIKLIV